MTDQKKVTGGTIFLSFAGVLVAVLILVYGWPTRYRYDHYGNMLIRIDRFNEEIQYFTFEGWKTYEEKPNKTAELMRDLWAGVSSSNQADVSSSDKAETRFKIAPAEAKSTYDPEEEQAKAEEFLNQAGQVVPIQELNSIQCSCEINTQGFKCQINNTLHQDIVAIVLKFETQSGPIYKTLNERVKARQATTLRWDATPEQLEKIAQYTGSITLWGASVAK